MIVAVAGGFARINRLMRSGGGGRNGIGAGAQRDANNDDDDRTGANIGADGGGPKLSTKDAGTGANIGLLLELSRDSNDAGIIIGLNGSSALLPMRRGGDDEIVMVAVPKGVWTVFVVWPPEARAAGELNKAKGLNIGGKIFSKIRGNCVSALVELPAAASFDVSVLLVTSVALVWPNEVVGSDEDDELIMMVAPPFLCLRTIGLPNWLAFGDAESNCLNKPPPKSSKSWLNIGSKSIGANADDELRCGCLWAAENCV